MATADLRGSPDKSGSHTREGGWGGVVTFCNSELFYTLKNVPFL